MFRKHGRRARGATVAAAVAAALWSPSGPAQQPPSLNVDVGHCVNLPTPEERSACYEASVEAAQRPHEAGGATGPSTAPAATAPAVTAPAATASAATASAQESSEPVEIVATVTEARETVPKRLLITLDNGQVWRQTRATKFYPLRLGQQVTLRSTKWGDDYRLTTAELKGFLQVERLR